MSIATLALALSASAAAGAGPDADAPDGPIARIVDEQTAVVLLWDLRAVRWRTLEAFIGQSLPPSDAPAAERAELAKLAVDVFRGERARLDELAAAGAGRAYMIYNAGDPPGGDRATVVVFGNLPLETVVPIDPGTRPAAVTAVFDRWANDSVYYTSARVGDLLVYGFKPVVAAVRDRPPAPRPELSAALAAGGRAPIRLVVAPTAQMLRDGLAKCPRLPPELGAVQTSDLIGGLRWVSLSVHDEGERVSARLTARYADPAAAAGAARALEAVLAAAAKFFLADPEPAAARALAGLRPRADGDRVELAIDQAALSALIGPHVRRTAAAALEGQRQWSVERGEISRMTSATHMAYLLMYAEQHADAHGGAWPADLQALEKAAGGPKKLRELLVNPAQPDRSRAYRYVRPAAGADRAKAIVLYEIVDNPDERINVGFANGRMTILTRAQVEAAIDKAASGPATRPR